MDHLSVMEGKFMKKTIATALVAAMVAVMATACGSNTTTTTGQQSQGEKQYTVGIAQFAVHASLDNCREGFLKGLEEEGLVEGENLNVLYENANGEATTGAQIISNFVTKKADLVCAIATPMAQTAYSVTKNTQIPVVYTAVTDPVLAELATKDKNPIGNITGTSDKLPVKEQLKMIREILPDAKTIGIMYSTSEVNSTAAIEEYKQLAGQYGFTIVESGISTTADIPLAADNLVKKVDCITNLTDNTVVSSLPVILDKANKANVPVFGSEVEQVKKGCVAAMGLDYVALGEQTGKMAAKILKGEEKAEDMQYEVIDTPAFYGNTEAAKKLSIEIPEDLTSNAAELFDTIVTE